MEELVLARDMAISLGASITDNDVGFIACFDSEETASSYVENVNNTWDDVTAEDQEKCAVVVTVASLM